LLAPCMQHWMAPRDAAFRPCAPQGLRVFPLRSAV
jgi:hypothetical protein